MSIIDLPLIKRALNRASAPLSPAPEGKYAAVAAVLRPGPLGAEVLLIRRAEHALDPWSGHMAFPGGRYDRTDESLLATAVRETREEVGLDLEQHASLLGPLDALPAIAKGRPAGLVIAPFVFALEDDVVLRPNHEVVETLWAPLARLASGEHAAVVEYQLEGQTLELPGWNVEGRIVWGLTYRMLHSLLELVQPAE